MYVILLGKERKEHGGLNSGVVLILGWFKAWGVTVLYCLFINKMGRNLSNLLRFKTIQ